MVGRQPGASWAVRRVLERHDLVEPYADGPQLESAVRVTPDGTRIRCLLNHGDEPVEVPTITAGKQLHPDPVRRAGAA